MLIAGAYLAIALLANSWPMWVLFALVVLLIVLPVFADRSAIMAELYKPRGPRTDVRYMTKAELYRSGRSFLVGGAALAIVLMALTGLTSLFANPRSELPFLMSVFFLLVILECALLFGGVYLLFRGLLRRRSYDPHLVFLLDSLKSADRD